MPCGTKSTGEEVRDQVVMTYLWASSNGTNGDYGTATVPTEKYIKTTYGECIPGFHKKKREGVLLPATNFIQFEAHGKVVPGTATIHTQGSGWWMRNDTTNYAYPGAWWLTQDDLLKHVDYDAPHVFVQGAAAQIYSGGHDMLTFLAELKKSVVSFKKIAGYFRKGGIPKRADELFGVWLEGRYSARTFAYDLQDLYEAVTRVDDGRTRFSERTGSTTKTFESNLQEGLAIGGGSYNVLHSDVVTVSTRGHVVADMEPPVFQFNPVVTGYELLPWSYMADWVIGVGTWLEAMSFLLFAKDYQADGGQLVTVERTSDVAGFVPYTGDSNTYSGTITVSATCKATYCWRKPMRVPLEPQRGSGLDNLKLMDVIAMMRQIKLKAQRRRKPRRFKTATWPTSSIT